MIHYGRQSALVMEDRCGHSRLRYEPGLLLDGMAKGMELARAYGADGEVVSRASLAAVRAGVAV